MNTIKQLVVILVTASAVGSIRAEPSGTGEVLVSLSDDGEVLNGASVGDAAIVLRTGEEEYRASLPLGAWYDIAPVMVDKNGVQTRLNCRTMRMDATTYRGQLNILLSRLKDESPDREIYLVSSAADSSSVSTNGVGALPGDYAAAVREAGNVWAVTVVDLAGNAPVSAPASKGLFRSLADATNRPPASVGISTVGCALDSRREQSAVSCAVTFFSSGIDGMSLTLM